MFSTLSTSLFTYMSPTSHNKGCSYETRIDESISWLSCGRPNRSSQPLFFFLTHHQPHYPPPGDRICKVIHTDWKRRDNHDHLAKIFPPQHLDLSQVLLDPERGEARKGVLEPALVHHLQRNGIFWGENQFHRKAGKCWQTFARHRSWVSSSQAPKSSGLTCNRPWWWW